MIASFIPFTVSAADSTAFKICVAAQDSKSVTITLDCTGGTGFGALDASIKYNNLKLSLEDCQFASGFAAFKQYVDSKNGLTIFNANSDMNPVKISVATTVPFKVIDGDGAIIKIRFSKIEGANISESDISLTIDNCQNENFEDIKTSVSYDLKAGSSSSSNDLIIEAGKNPEEEEAEILDGSKTTTTTSQSVNGADKTENNSAQQKEAEETVKVDNGLSNTKKTVVIIIIAVVLIAGIGALVVIFNKNKKA